MEARQTLSWKGPPGAAKQKNKTKQKPRGVKKRTKYEGKENLAFYHIVSNQSAAAQHLWAQMYLYLLFYFVLF